MRTMKIKTWVMLLLIMFTLPNIMIVRGNNPSFSITQADTPVFDILYPYNKQTCYEYTRINIFGYYVTYDEEGDRHWVEFDYFRISIRKHISYNHTSNEPHSVEVFSVIIPYNETFPYQNRDESKQREYIYNWNTCAHPNGRYYIRVSVWKGDISKFGEIYVKIDNYPLDSLLGFPTGLPIYTLDLLIYCTLIGCSLFLLLFIRRRRN